MRVEEGELMLLYIICLFCFYHFLVDQSRLKQKDNVFAHRIMMLKKKTSCSCP